MCVPVPVPSFFELQTGLVPDDATVLDVLTEEDVASLLAYPIRRGASLFMDETVDLSSGKILD